MRISVSSARPPSEGKYSFCRPTRLTRIPSILFSRAAVTCTNPFTRPWTTTNVAGATRSSAWLLRSSHPSASRRTHILALPDDLARLIYSWWMKKHELLQEGDVDPVLCEAELSCGSAGDAVPLLVRWEHAVLVDHLGRREQQWRLTGRETGDGVGGCRWGEVQGGG